MLTPTGLAGDLAAGVVFGLSLIVAVGPQNTFVLRQGIRREHVALVVTVCSASDVLLIGAGTAGAGAVLDGRLWLVRVVGGIGVAFLLGYAALAARRALRPAPAQPAPAQPASAQPTSDQPLPGSGEPAQSGEAGVAVTTAPPRSRRGSRAAALAACLAFTWLNPAVYLDTVVVVAPVSQSHGDGRWWFALGAGVASLVWFTALGFGARAAAPLFDRPKAWRVLDASVAIIMLITAVRVATSL